MDNYYTCVQPRVADEEFLMCSKVECRPEWCVFRSLKILISKEGFCVSKI